MRKPKFLLLMGLACMLAVLPWGGNLAFANTGHIADLRLEVRPISLVGRWRDCGLESEVPSCR